MSDLIPPFDRVMRALSLPEGETLDFKRVKDVASAVKTAIALANTHGGFLVLGIDDARKATGRDRVWGIEENPEAVGELMRLLQTQVTPPLAKPALSKDSSSRRFPARSGMGHPGALSCSMCRRVTKSTASTTAPPMCGRERRTAN